MCARLLYKLMLLTGLASAASGCGFSIGSDYRVTVTWLINGTAPDAALCRENGVDRIRFTVLSPGKERTIEANCEETLTLDDGYDYGAFDSTRSFDYGVRYRYRVEMVDSAGDTLPDLSYNDSFTVYYGDDVPWVLPPLELFSPTGTVAALRGAWTINGRKPTQADCDRLGAVAIAIDVASSTDTKFQDPVEMARGACTDGSINTGDAVLGHGEYNIRYVALDKNDDVVDDIILDALFRVDDPGTLALDRVDF